MLLPHYFLKFVSYKTALSKQRTMEKQLIVDITKGIPTQNFAQLLQQYDRLILKGATKSFDIKKDSVTLFQHQELTLNTIPDQIEGTTINDFQKTLLLQGEKILVGDKLVGINEEKTHLEIERNDGQQQLKIS